MLLGKFHVALDHHLGTFHGNDLASVLVDKVLRPGVNHTGGKTLTDDLLQVGFGHLHLFSQGKDVQDILVCLITDSPEQRSDRELFLTVDVGIHHIVDIRGELHPRALERDDTGGIELGAVGVELRAEEHTGRTVQLRHHHTLGSIDDERSLGCHIRYHTQVHRLFYRLKIFVLGVVARKLDFRFQRDTIRQPAFNALFNGVARRVDEIVKKL